MLGVIMWVVKWGLLILIAKKCDKVLDRLGSEVMTNSRLTQAKALGSREAPPPVRVRLSHIHRSSLIRLSADSLTASSEHGFCTVRATHCAPTASGDWCVVSRHCPCLLMKIIRDREYVVFLLQVL